MRQKRISVAGSEIVLRVQDRQAERITRSWPYRHLLGPALRRLSPGSNGHEPAAAVAVTPLSAAAPAPAARPAANVPVVYPRPVQMPEDTPEQRAIVEQIKVHEWYHTIVLDHGVRTPGLFDHEPALPYVPLPASLAGKRCLDVATYDGFWAFEMERRGAAEVVALDIASWMDLDVPSYQKEEFRRQGYDISTGTGFEIAARLLGSKVQRRICNVYDLSPEVLGEFDFVFCSDIMIHLSNPHRALQNICSVARGEAMLLEPYEPSLDAAGLGPLAQFVGLVKECRWWQFGELFLERAIRVAGFESVELAGKVDIRIRNAQEASVPRAIYRARRGGTVAAE
jgi:tRNA (mo5U34)-methyltransferase